MEQIGTHIMASTFEPVVTPLSLTIVLVTGMAGHCLLPTPAEQPQPTENRATADSIPDVSSTPRSLRHTNDQRKRNDKPTIRSG